MPEVPIVLEGVRFGLVLVLLMFALWTPRTVGPPASTVSDDSKRTVERQNVFMVELRSDGNDYNRTMHERTDGQKTIAVL